MNFDIGKEIGLARGTRYGYTNIRFGHIVKINGYGHIYVDTGVGDLIRFDKCGRAYKDAYGPYLVDPDHLRRYMAEEKKRKEIADTVRQIETTIKGGWSYNGVWHTNADRIAALKTAVAELERIG